jgi:hypothetical protein
MAPDTQARLHAIYNATWMVRHYAPARTPTMREQRAAAIRQLGLLVRDALVQTEDDFEPILTALVDGLNPRNDRPF